MSRETEPFITPWLLAQPNLTFLSFEAAHNREELFSLRESGLMLCGLRRAVLRCRIRRVDVAREILQFHDLVSCAFALAHQHRTASIPSGCARVSSL
jgi:hypothetical protein